MERWIEGQVMDGWKKCEWLGKWIQVCVNGGEIDF